MDFTLLIEARHPEGEELEAEAIDEFASRMQSHAGVVGTQAGYYSSQFDVSAYDMADAIEIGHKLFTEGAHGAGFPSWPIVSLEVMTVEEQGRRLELPSLPSLVGVSEAAEILGVSKQRVSELHRDSRLPPTVADLAAGPVWVKNQIAAFVDRWQRKPGRPRGSVAVTTGEGTFSVREAARESRSSAIREPAPRTLSH